MTSSRSARQIFADSRATLVPALHDALASVDERNRTIAEYHLGFRDETSMIAEADGGKLVRGTLALLSAQAAGGDTTAGLSGAVAVELIHNSSLLHDDIIDRDEIRRHRPTAWRVFGTAEAILAGDAALALAMQVVAEDDIADSAAKIAAITALTSATGRMLAGQAGDIAFESAEQVSLAESEEMIAGKTGALLACATSIGATLAGADSVLTAQLHALGQHLGMAFQLIDDILGIWGHPERTGKSAASDLAAKKRSLPVVAALVAGGPDADRLRVYYAQHTPLSVKDLAAAAQAISDAGGRDWAQRQAHEHTAAALDIIDDLSVGVAVRDELRTITNLLCGRDH